MEVILVALGLFATSSADICESPMEGGVGEPMFCRVEPDLRIETPTFSIDTHPSYLVGVDSGGERLQMQDSIWQSQSALQIRVVPNSEEGSSPVRSQGCSEYFLNGADALFCDRSSDGVTRRQYFFPTGDASIVVELSATELAESLLPILESILQSLEIQGP